jgi:hypothetical protein
VILAMPACAIVELLLRNKHAHHWHQRGIRLSRPALLLRAGSRRATPLPDSFPFTTPKRVSIGRFRHDLGKRIVLRDPFP